MEPTFILDGPGRKNRVSFADIFAKLTSESDTVEIAVGYASLDSLQHLLTLCKSREKLHVYLTLGMHGREGMTTRQLDAARELSRYLHSAGRGEVFVTPRIPFHGKIYLFDKKPEPTGYIGSANLSSIVPGYFGTLETGIMVQSGFRQLRQYLEETIYPYRESIEEYDVPIVETPGSPMYHVDEAQFIEQPEVVKVFNAPHSHEFRLPLKAEKASNLNAHLGGGGKRTNAYGGIARDWYEGELIVSKKITSLPGYPKTGEEFDVITDDSWKFRMKISGQNGKNLRSAGRLSTFGTWLKTRFVEKGALEFGETATAESIEKLELNFLVMKYRPSYNVWTFELQK